VFKPIPWSGSYQDLRAHVQSENSLEEAWIQFARLGTQEALALMNPDNPALPWAEYVSYAKVRLHQAIEFRAAAHVSSILTAPLPLYYAFLNLMRAQLALIPEVLPSNAHGLRFRVGSDLLSSEAELQKGTFTDYLDVQNVPWQKGDRISLRDALGCIIEMHSENRMFDATLPHTQIIGVEASSMTPAILTFYEYPRNLSAHWVADFPSLAAHCEFTPESTLKVKKESCNFESYEAIGMFLHKNLLNNLTVIDRPMWWALRNFEQYLKLDRLGYYHVSAFILGSAVRYNPQLMLAISGPDSGVGWLIKRFLSRAERFYPQLQMSYGQKGRQVYF
jgi:hypothetical protein